MLLNVTDLADGSLIGILESVRVKIIDTMQADVLQSPNIDGINWSTLAPIVLSASELRIRLVPLLKKSTLDEWSIIALLLVLDLVSLNLPALGSDTALASRSSLVILSIILAAS